MNEAGLSRLLLKDTAFQNLMQKRVFNVLLIASPYDAFMMEEDGRVEEQIYFEYTALNLSSPPRVTQASDFATALERLAEKHFDLIIAMPGVDISDTFAHAKIIKELYPGSPFIVLTPFSRAVSRRLEGEDFSGVDYVFSWLGNVDLLLAIVKLMEDRLNADNDINEVGVQLIMLVEDSVRFYSSILPTVYKFLLRQSHIFSTEALNDHEKMMRMRGRPKVMLARDYEEAMDIYHRYGKNLLGVISDVSFKHNGTKEPKAGITLARELRALDPYLPIIIESSDTENGRYVADFNGRFIHKNSKTLPDEIGNAIMKDFGFGDFVVKNPQTGEEILRIRNLKDLQKHVFDIPAESLLYHASYNDISRWLYSRALFPIADVIKMHRFKDISEAPAVRQMLFDLIVKYRKMKNRGVVAVFNKDRFDHYSNFARIGQGSLGGKGRGLAFIDSIIKNNPEFENYFGVSIATPRTVVLCTDVFDEFMEINKLYATALSDKPDNEILRDFLNARLPERLTDDFFALFEVIDKPLAVRSSSLLEDSHYQPFAGIYATYMIPHEPNKFDMLTMLENAIKSVYASVFFAESKAYMMATQNLIDQEKMAVIIQEVVGNEHNRLYYPSFSGVGRSLNYYPINDEQPEDGVVEVAIGLGKYIVDGGRALRFSPRHPNKILQTSTLDIALRDTQTRFYALDMNSVDNAFSVDDGFNIKQVQVQDITDSNALKYMVSTYDFRSNIIRDTHKGDGRKVVTFANVLKHNVYPLAQAAELMLSKGQAAMARPVEIEFAGIIDNSANLRDSNEKGQIYWLQIRPIVDRKEMLDETILEADDNDLILKSTTALGHGMMDNITSIVMVKPSWFSMEHNPDTARKLEEINRQFTQRDEGYILVGPGRWGSSDSALGIPVKWAHISAAKLIVETSLQGNRIEPSQGTHFFQNLTSFGVGYFTVGVPGDGSVFDTEFLNSLPAKHESNALRIVEFDEPLTVAINGRKSLGIVMKPGVKPQARRGNASQKLSFAAYQQE